MRGERERRFKRSHREREGEERERESARARRKKEQISRVVENESARERKWKNKNSGEEIKGNLLHGLVKDQERESENTEGNNNNKKC